MKFHEERADRAFLHVRIRDSAARLHDNHQLTGETLDPIPPGRTDFVPLEADHPVSGNSYPKQKTPLLYHFWLVYDSSQFSRSFNLLSVRSFHSIAG